jgi:hypothetical protein
MAARAPTRRAVLAGLLAAPLAVPAAGAGFASEAHLVRGWLEANRMPYVDPNLPDGVWRRCIPVHFHVAISDLPMERPA